MSLAAPYAEWRESLSSGRFRRAHLSGTLCGLIGYQTVDPADLSKWNTLSYKKITFL